MSAEQMREHPEPLAPWFDLCDSYEDGALVLSADGLVLYANEAALAFMAQDVVDKSLIAVAPDFNNLFAQTATPVADQAFQAFNVLDQSGRTVGLLGRVKRLTQRGTTPLFLCLMRTPDPFADPLFKDGFVRAILMSSNNAVIATDMQNRIVVWNNVAEGLYGYTRDEVLGQPIDSVLSPELEQERATHVKEMFAARKPVSFETVRVNKKGQILDVAITLAPIFDKQGEAIGVSKIVCDIKERKEAEGNKGLLAAIVRSTTDAIVSVTIDGLITSWNQGAETLYGYKAEEVIGRQVNFIVPEVHAGEIDEVLAKIKAGERVVRLDTTRLDKSGHEIAVSSSISPVFDRAGRVIGASKVEQDCRARKETDRRIQENIEALERSNQELDEFAYIASHDLREPLRGIVNNMNFLKEDCEPKLSGDDMKRLDRMAALCDRMAQLIDDLLYYSRLGRQALAVVPTDLNKVITDIRFMMEGFLNESQAQIHLPAALPVVVCDATRITEVFRNLITNGVKYNDKEKKIIEIGVVAPSSTSPKENVFYVRDNGMGIPEHFYNDVFQMFKRLKQENEAVKGTGVGLSFVKKIVERHHGRVWVDSVEGQGSTFYFSLPA